MYKAIVLSALFSFSALAEPAPRPIPFPQVKGAASDSLKGTMQEILKTIADLQPKMVSSQEYSNSKNQISILESLGKLKGFTSEVKHMAAVDKGGYRISSQVLEEQIKVAESAFRLGNKDYSRWALTSALSVCVSCHTQLPSGNRGKWDFDVTVGDKKTFEAAEFLFATRSYDEAVAIYDTLIDSYPKTLQGDQLDTALSRKLTYFARVKRNPDLGLLSMEKSLKNKKLPKYLEKDLKAWVALFREWQQQKDPDVYHDADSKIKEWAEKQLKRTTWDKMVEADEGRKVTYLRVSGLLYEFLITRPDMTIKPEVLRWLAQCDRGLSNNFFFSLADLYLRECIVKHSQNPVAKLCFKDYEESVVSSYSGSSGTHVPEDVNQELAKLRKLVGSK